MEIQILIDYNLNGQTVSKHFDDIEEALEYLEQLKNENE